MFVGSRVSHCWEQYLLRYNTWCCYCGICVLLQLFCSDTKHACIQDVPWDRVLAGRLGASCHIAAAPLQGTSRSMHALHTLTAGREPSPVLTVPLSADCTTAESSPAGRPFLAPCGLIRLRALSRGAHCAQRARARDGQSRLFVGSHPQQ